MKLRKLLFATVALALTALTAMAAPRTAEQMKQAALQAINQQRSAKRHAPRLASELQVLKSTNSYEVIGHQEAGFAIIAKDDLAPEVLGVSMKRYNESNKNFLWWLKAVSQAVEYAVANNTPLASVAPDPAKFPTSVEPMLTTEWDQDAPYSNMCPTYDASHKCLTGCVATAMAQVLNYFKTPEHGIGQRTIYYPYNNHNGEAVTADFENDYYDWDNMIDNYAYGYTDVQAQAVALLMRDCGVAANMQYDYWEGSGAYSQDAAQGLRQYFGFEEAQCYERDNGYGSKYYSDEEWMDMVFRAISEDGPIYYGGTDPDPWFGGGHAFVLHGYNAQGQVYVNWGWSGDDDGYFDIALLNPSGNSFSVGQDMIIGVKGAPRELTDENIALSQPGTLSSQITDEQIGTVGTLKVSGNINSSDLLVLRKLAGVDEYGERTQGYLQSLDLSEARFVEGGNAYLVDNGRSLTTSDDILPERAFYGCRTLKSITLPAGIKTWGDGALGLCSRLDDIQIGTPASDATFLIVDGIVWNPDKTEIIAVLPNTTGELIIEKGTKALHDYAVAGCSRLTKVEVPVSIETIGREAFRSTAMGVLRVLHKEPPTLTGIDVFAGVSAHTTQLSVPAGTKDVYARKAQWSVFADNIHEFGSAVKVRNTIRKYGEENPTLTYTVQGDPIVGEPVLTCEATPESPAGRYPITISAGTITDEFVEFIDGYLVVQKVEATATVQDATREQGQPNPDFKLQYEGLVLNDTEPVWTTNPVFTCDADESSAPGQYPITVTAVAESYELTFIAGTLTVTESTTGISTATTQQGKASQWTTIDGRHLDSRPSRKGVYIVNGKKVIR